MEDNIVQIINQFTVRIKEVSAQVVEFEYFSSFSIAIVGVGLMVGIFFFAAKLSIGTLTDSKKIFSEVKRMLIVLIVGLLSVNLINLVDSFGGFIESQVAKLQDGNISSSSEDSKIMTIDQTIELSRRMQEGYKNLSQEDYDRVTKIQDNSLISNEGSLIEKEHDSKTQIVDNATNTAANKDMLETDKLFEKSCFSYSLSDWFVVIILTVSACVKLLATALLSLLKLIAILLCPIAFALSFAPKFEDTYKTWLYSYVAVVLSFSVMSLIEFISVRFALLAGDGDASSMVISAIMSLLCAVAIWLSQQFTTAFLCGSQSLGSIGTSVLATTYMGSKLAASQAFKWGGKLISLVTPSPTSPLGENSSTNSGGADGIPS